MLPKLRNERTISFTFKYNTKRSYYAFDVNHNNFKTDIFLTSKMIGLALQNDNAEYFRVVLKMALDKIYEENRKIHNY
jgi:hypothetical protein